MINRIAIAAIIALAVYGFCKGWAEAASTHSQSKKHGTVTTTVTTTVATATNYLTDGKGNILTTLTGDRLLAQ